MTITENAINATKAVLAKCAANDPWFPHPAEATILAWADQFVIAKLPLDDLLAAVTQVYATNGGGYKPLPADIVRAARAIRADRMQRETDEQRRAREDHLDARIEKRAAEIAAIPAGVITGPTKNRTERLKAAEKSLQCAVDKRTAQEAIAEYCAAKREARKAA